MDEQTNVKSLLKERLGQDLLSILERISQVASRSEVTVFAVGGFVRDLLLNIPNKDIDIVVEGNGILFASDLAENSMVKLNPMKNSELRWLSFPMDIELM